MSEGGGFIPPITIVDFDNPDALFNIVSSDRDDPWENKSFVRQVFLDFGCTRSEFEAAWRTKGTHRELRKIAKTVFLFRSQQRGLRLKAAGKHFRKNPDQLAAVQGWLSGTIPAPCPSPGTSTTGDRRSGPVFGAIADAIRQRFPRGDTGQARTKAPGQDTAPRSTQPRTPPAGGTQRPPAISQQALADLLELVEALREWWLARQAARDAEREAKRIRRAQLEALEAQQMALSDVLSGLGSGLADVITAAAPIGQQILANQAQVDIAKIQARQQPAPQLGFGSLLPTPGGPPPFIPMSQQQTGFGDLLPLLPGAGAAIQQLIPSMTGTGATQLFRVTPSGNTVPNRTVTLPGPRGNLHTWQYAGRPVLYSGDVRTCKRVKKVARGVAGSVGLRFQRSTRRRRR